MKYLNIEEKKAIAAFFVSEFADAVVVRDVDGRAQEITLCQPSDAAALVEPLTDDSPIEMLDFMKLVYESLAAQFGRVYACWYADGAPFAGTFFQSATDEDAATDISIQMNALALGTTLENAAAMYRLGDDEGDATATRVNVYDLGQWATEWLSEELALGRRYDDVAAAVADLEKRLMV